jgi:regulator of sigma E protease
MFGIQIEPLVVKEPPRLNFVSALAEAGAFSVRIIPEAIKGFGQGFAAVVTGQKNENLAGPIGIVREVNRAAQVGLIPVLALAAIINFSLAIFNLLPIPGLDGGRMLLATIVALRGKPFKPGQEEFIHFIGIMAVLAFMVLVTFNELGGLLFRPNQAP